MWDKECNTIMKIGRKKHAIEQNSLHYYAYDL